MKKIIDISTKEEVEFSKEDLPILVHGIEHSGASLLSITIAVHLHEAGEKLCIFTAYPMAKDEFLQQIQNKDTVFYLENEEDLEKASQHQTIIVQSGNLDLFIKIISDENLVNGRVIFVKNIETIKVPVFDLVTKYPFLISGDVDINVAQGYFVGFEYKTKIQLTPILDSIIPPLQKYQAFYKKGSSEIIIAVV